MTANNLRRLQSFAVSYCQRDELLRIVVRTNGLKVSEYKEFFVHFIKRSEMREISFLPFPIYFLLSCPALDEVCSERADRCVRAIRCNTRVKTFWAADILCTKRSTVIRALCWIHIFTWFSRIRSIYKRGEGQKPPPYGLFFKGNFF